MPFFLGPVSEDEVTREANDIGVSRESYAKDLLGAVEGGGRGKGGADAEVYSFQLASDRCRLSFQKILHGLQVSLKGLSAIVCRIPALE